MTCEAPKEMEGGVGNILSLNDYIRQEVDRYKWLESEKAGYDLGLVAIRDWSRKYWVGWCRARWMEHLTGIRYWAEFDAGDFGLLNRRFHHNTDLISAIVNHFRNGGENLGIIQWVLDTNNNLEDAIEILKHLDINKRRRDSLLPYGT